MHRTNQVRESVDLIERIGGRYWFAQEPLAYFDGKQIQTRPDVDISTAFDLLGNKPSEWTVRKLSMRDRLRQIVGDEFFVDVEGIMFGFRKVEDDHLSVLANNSKLKFLDLTQTEVTDKGMRFLATCSNLRNLRLSQTAVTDVGIAKLTSLKNLEVLILDNTRVTSAAVLSLKQMKKLQFVSAVNTKFSAKAEFELEILLPDCQVNR